MAEPQTVIAQGKKQKGEMDKARVVREQCGLYPRRNPLPNQEEGGKVGGKSGAAEMDELGAPIGKEKAEPGEEQHRGRTEPT